jgi:hypothetical protein
LNALTCPHCGKPALTLGQKIMFGPAKVVECQHCSKPYGMPLARSLLTFIPVFAWAMVRMSIDSTALSVGLLVVAVLITSAWYVYGVPLVRR